MVAQGTVTPLAQVRFLVVRRDCSVMLGRAGMTDSAQVCHMFVIGSTAG